MVQLAIKEKAALYAAYVPLFAEGGVFIPTSREYKLGDDVYVLMTLPDDTSVIRSRARWHGLPRRAPLAAARKALVFVFQPTKNRVC